ncbi:MAG TPA: type I-E CRISPR-associated protein Cas6/Cse3/CasE [Pseudonocardiaceae bacterium]
MAFLSRIWLNPLRTGAQKLIGNPQVTHAAVLGGLSRQPVTERVLWRLEEDGPHRACLLVLTASSPSWEHIIERAGWPSSLDEQATVRSYKPLLDRVQKGREFAFRLRANPTVTTKNLLAPTPAQRRHLEGSPRPRGIRVPHRTAAQQLDWFLTKAGTWGFEIPATTAGHPDVLLTARRRMAFRKPSGPVTIETATFEGRLRIADVDAAVSSLLGGVGPARAYGCGLITLAPTGG